MIISESHTLHLSLNCRPFVSDSAPLEFIFYTKHRHTLSLTVSSIFLPVFTHSRQDLDRFYFFLPPASSGMKTLTVKSPLSVPYLFFTRMLYLPESAVFTPVMVKLANLPDSNLRMQ